MSEGPVPPVPPSVEPPGEMDEPPTIPPAPRSGPGLRWAVREAVPGPTAPAARRVPAGEPATRQLTVPVLLGPDVSGPPETPVGVPHPAQGGPDGRRGVWGLVALLVLAAAVGGALVIARPGQSTTPGRSLEKLLLRSDQARQLVLKAVAGACSTQPPASPARQKDLSQLEQAVAMRTSVLASLGAERSTVAEVPDGLRLANQLRSLTESSLSADRDYEAWFIDRQAMGCYGDPTNDVHFRAAQQAATAAASQAAALQLTWAPVAQRLHLPTGLGAEA